MSARGFEMHHVEIELNLDDSTLPRELPSQQPDNGAARIRDLTAERAAAYRQMQRLMEDIGRLRENEQRIAASHQSVMADMMFRMALIAESRKGGGVEHVVRVGVMSALLANEMGWSGERCDAIQLAAPLRDTGWAGMPDYWLNTDENDPGERLRTQAHCRLGAQILGGAGDPAMAMAAVIAASHHERHNGSGYPDRLMADAIPMAARIAGCIDVFDALTRGYGDQPGMTPADAMAQVMRADAWFHPELRAALGHVRELLVGIRNALDASVLTDEVRSMLRGKWRPGFWRCFAG